MKKVLLMMLALGLLASPALAAVVANSKHNLATTGPGTVKSNNYEEVCVFCHTPHGASTSVTNAPLWNRTYSMAALAATDLYTSTTLTAASTPDAALAAAIAATDAPLCFSCHDGTSVTDGLVNPSNLEANVQPAGIGPITTADILGDGAGANKLKNDHPIGMVYATAQSADAGLVASPAGITFYGGRMWCSSCHDVHDNQHAPFLAKSNAASALCTSCHNK